MDFAEKMRFQKRNNEKVALALLQHCKDNGLTIGQTRNTLKHALDLIDVAVRDYGIEKLCIQGFYQTGSRHNEDK